MSDRADLDTEVKRQARAVAAASKRALFSGTAMRPSLASRLLTNAAAVVAR